MNPRIVTIRAAAQADADEAYDWYEEKRTGLGGEFLTSVGDTLDGLVSWPDRGLLVYRNLRRVAVKRFPYGVFYIITDNEIALSAFFMGGERRGVGNRDSTSRRGIEYGR